MDIKNTKMHEFYNLFWNYIKKYYQLDLKTASDEEVNLFKADMEAIKIRYKDNEPLQKMAVKFMVAYMTYLEEKNGKSN